MITASKEVALLVLHLVKWTLTHLKAYVTINTLVFKELTICLEFLFFHEIGCPFSQLSQCMSLFNLFMHSATCGEDCVHSSITWTIQNKSGFLRWKLACIDLKWAILQTLKLGSHLPISVLWKRTRLLLTLGVALVDSNGPRAVQTYIRCVCGGGRIQSIDWVRTHLCACHIPV